MLTLNDLVSYLKKSYATMRNPPVNFILENNYFFTDFPPAPPLPTSPTRAGSTPTTTTTTSGYRELGSRLTTLRYRRRAPRSEYGYAVKSIVDPLACRQMHNHYCWAVTPAYELRGEIEVLSNLLAVNQHYKECHFNETMCAEALRAATVDDATMAPHRDKLIANVDQQIRAIFHMSPSEFLRRFT